MVLVVLWYCGRVESTDASDLGEEWRQERLGLSNNNVDLMYITVR